MNKSTIFASAAFVCANASTDVTTKDGFTAIGLRAGWTATGIKGTMWTTSPIGPKTDPTVTDPVAKGPACELPTLPDGFKYTTPYVIAVGWSDKLGDLKMSSSNDPSTSEGGKCGQVYEIQCDDGETIQAIVISSGTNADGSGMGIDMQEPAYEAATGTPTGTTVCNARLSTANPITGKDYQCFHRYVPADKGNDWYASITLLNTNGKLVKSASLEVDGIKTDGVRLATPGSSFFNFQSLNKGPLTATTPVTFTFEDADAAPVTVQYGDCTWPENMNTFTGEL